MSARVGFEALLVCALLGGCASVPPPPELVDARVAYARAAHGPAAQLDPADLKLAKQWLDAAEQSFVDHWDSQETKDIGYTAARRAEIAESKARSIMFASRMDQTVSQVHDPAVSR